MEAWHAAGPRVGYALPSPRHECVDGRGRCLETTAWPKLRVRDRGLLLRVTQMNDRAKG